ncbi:ThiF family protein [Caballeronia pedi]|uniref:ThiF family protein n=1 Tax=Caballeronia pedi TaxID=1777141 RepID=A0A157ZR38_9BURK|nr:ThiF family adenylyltransferase [Caballeronia pedi]SAK47961.1 ThiF family protein [Caballeronia pedi]
MSEQGPTGSELSRALASRGFAYVGHDEDGWFVFSGSLISEETPFSVRLEVDPDGKDLPRVYLAPIPAALQPVAPHVGADGSFCYLAHGAIVLDVFDIVGQVLACIERAEAVLGQILRGELTQDLEEEFFSCWPQSALCLLDFEEKGHLPLSVLVLDSKDEARPITAVSDDTNRTLSKLAAIGLSVDSTRKVTVRRVRTTAPPRALQEKWPPETVADVLKWQATLDPRARRKLEDLIHAEAKTDANSLLCIIESPRFVYAFAVEYDRREKGQRARDFKSLEVAYRSPVVPMFCLRIDDQYTAERSTPGRRTLAGKQIILVGCGTIGGFLGEYLVKAGAGTGGGALSLVDNDILLPQNVGRHRLGLNYILRNKAEALAKELRRGAPGAKLIPIPVNALQVDLSRADLIVDATGEEAFGHLLARKLSADAFRPMLSVWIEGPGTAIRALMRDSRDAACVRCLKTRDRSPIYKVTEGELPQMLAGHGCESLYVPFPATVSVQAASLAADMAVDWANANCSPRLRTRVLDPRWDSSRQLIDPAQLQECPACTT